MQRAWIILFLVAAPLLRSESGDVQLTLSAVGDRSTFRIGEVIALSLSYRTDVPKKYQLTSAFSGQSDGNWEILPNTGWDDPMELYSKAYSMWAGGGLASITTLSSTPANVLVDLNAVVRFRQPGRYRLKLISSHVSRLGDPLRGAPMEIESNEIALNIIAADPEWQHKTLQKALAMIDGHGASDARADAVKTLRYLGTEDAAKAMVRRMNDPDYASQYKLGLLGSPVAEAALAEMKTLLASPDFPVTNEYIDTMSVLALQPGTGDLPDQREEFEKRFRRDLLGALAGKQGQALAVSANSVVEEAAMRGRELPPELKRELTETLVRNFEKLPLAAQDNLIEYRSHVLDQQALLPLLRKVAQRYQDSSQLREMRAFQFNSASGAALQQWYEADPAGARPAIIQEILRPKPRFNAAVLGGLPDKELPGADAALAEHLRQGPDDGNVASLIHRYASAALQGQVTNYLGENIGKLACATQEPLLAYLVKQDASAARPVLEAGMAARGEDKSACYRVLLPEVGKLESAPVLEEIAVAALDDRDSQVVAGAASNLKDYGSAAAEAVLWTHFSTWSQHWMGREAELRYIPGEKMDSVEAAGAGENMMQALATGQGWLADESKLRRLVQLSVGEQQRRQAEQYLQTWQARPWTILLVSRPGQFDIAQYHALTLQAAKDKLLQFPRGSVFNWPAGGLDDEEKIAKELRGFAAEHGIHVTRNP